MNKIGLAVLSNIVMIALITGAVIQAQSTPPAPKEPVAGAAQFQKTIQTYTEGMESVLGEDNVPVIHNMSGTPSNFEGPKVSIEFVSHHGEVWDREIEPYYVASGSYVDFDPDWESYGLPNLRVEVEQPRFVSPVENGVLEKNLGDVKRLLPGISDISPIKRYTKTYKTQDGEYRKEQYDLYLTEFAVTIGVKPLRADPVIPLSYEDKRKKLYPRSWYQDKLLAGEGSKVSISDFRHEEEYKNQRYSRVHVAFKVEPNNSAWYVSTRDGRQLDAEVAIGSIIPKSIVSNIKSRSQGDDKKYDIAHIDPGSPGVNVDMFSEPTFENRFDARKVLTSEPGRLDDAIFGKDVYFRITSNNIGSWDDRWVFIGDEWDDQFVIKFFMPILVKGQIDVALDSALIPTYSPPEGYFQSFSLSDLLPDWGFPNFGKYLTYALLLFVGIVVILFLPNLLVLVNSLLGIIVGLIRLPLGRRG